MASKPSLPAPNQPKVFKITEAQKRRWYFFWVRKDSLGSLLFIVMSPLFVLGMRWSMTASVPTYIVNGLTAMVLLASFSLLFLYRSLYREHLRRVLEIEVMSSGLRLKSGFGSPVEANWFEINDACRASSKELLIETKQGTFYAPADVPWADELVAEVRAKGSALMPPSDCCISIREGVVYGVRAAVFAVILAATFTTGRTILVGLTPSLGQVAACAIAFIGGAFIIKILRKLPLVLKVGAEGIFARTLEAERRFAWTQVKGIKSDSFSSTVTTTDGKLWLPWGMYTEESKKLLPPVEKQLLTDTAQKILKLT